MLQGQVDSEFVVDALGSPSQQQALRQLIQDQTGIFLRDRAWASLHTFFQRRLAELELSSFQDYCHCLNSSYERLQKNQSKSPIKEEWALLLQEVTNGESYFFRDSNQLQLIVEVLLPRIIAERKEALQKGLIQQPYLNLWSAGCSAGEEPHSLLILIRENFPELWDWNINLVATDLNPKAIVQGKLGLYRDWSLRQISGRYRDRYFQSKRTYWQIQPELTQMIQWHVLNLTDAEAIARRIPSATMDIILCRNVFIYFDALTIEKVLNNFHDCLDPSGYLLVGHAELEGIDLGAFQAQYELDSVVYQTNVARPKPQVPSVPVPRRPAPLHVQSGSMDIPESTEIDWGELNALLELEQLPLLKAQLQKLPTQCQNEFAYNWLHARLAFKEKNLERAELFAQKSLTTNSNSTEVLMLLCVIAQQKKQWDVASKILRKVLYFEPEHVGAHFKKFEIVEAQGQQKKAQKALEHLEQIIEPLSDSLQLDLPQCATIAQLKSYVTWKKLRHPYLRSSSDVLFSETGEILS